MIKPEQVPDEVVEAFRDAWTRKLNARKTIAAAINAWPGANRYSGCLLDQPYDHLILPLDTQENEQ